MKKIKFFFLIKISIFLIIFSTFGSSRSNLNHSANNSIELKRAQKIFKKKKSVTVAIIDTGVDANHPFLKRNMVKLKKGESLYSYGLDLSSNSLKDPTDNNGHGTHVTGIIKSIFPQVKIISLKYYNPNSKGKENLLATIKAFDYAIKHNVDIINFSGGGKTPYLKELEVLQKAEEKNILVVAAAGNNSLNLDLVKNNYFPASYKLKNIISVSAHDNSSKLRSSNFGKRTVHLLAPGHMIKGPLPKNRFGSMTGTSQATAYVTGVAALLKSQFPNLTPLQMKEILIQSSKSNVFEKKSTIGGKLDAYEALKLAKELEKNRYLAKTR